MKLLEAVLAVAVAFSCTLRSAIAEGDRDIAIVEDEAFWFRFTTEMADSFGPSEHPTMAPFHTPTIDPSIFLPSPVEPTRTPVSLSVPPVGMPILPPVLPGTSAPTLEPTTMPTDSNGSGSDGPSNSPNTHFMSLSPSAPPSLVPSPIPSDIPSVQTLSSASPSVSPDLQSAAPISDPPSLVPSPIPSDIPSVQTLSSASPSVSSNVQSAAPISSASPTGSSSPVTPSDTTGAPTLLAAPTTTRLPISSSPSISPGSTVTFSPSIGLSVPPTGTMLTPLPTTVSNLPPPTSSSGNPTSIPSTAVPVATLMPSGTSLTPSEIKTAAPSAVLAPSSVPVASLTPSTVSVATPKPTGVPSSLVDSIPSRVPSFDTMSLVPSVTPSRQVQLSPSESSVPENLSPTPSQAPFREPSTDVTSNPSFLVTDAPSSAPSSMPNIDRMAFVPTLLPTPSANIARGCNLTATVRCEDENGDECNFSDPIGEQCIGSDAQELQFIYIADSSCPGNNTQNMFDCIDEGSPSVDLPFTVHVRAFHDSSVFFDGIVNEGNIFKILITKDPNNIVIEISSVNSDGSTGLLLQRMMMSVQCREQDGVLLSDTFGALQLVGYRNIEQGLQTIFASVTMGYTVTNTASSDGLLTGAFKTTPFVEGMQPLLGTGERIPMAPGVTIRYSESFTLNLAAVVGFDLDFGFSVQGEATEQGEECGDADEYALLVAP